MKDKISQTYSNIGQRCNNPKATRYECYGGKGIKRLVTVEELRELFIRDHADKMKQPSIDRIDSSGHYKKSNLQWVEMSDNRKRHMGTGVAPKWALDILSKYNFCYAVIEKETGLDYYDIYRAVNYGIMSSKVLHKLKSLTHK